MKFIYIFLILFFVSSNLAFCQASKNVFIQGNVLSSELKTIEIIKCGIKSQLPFDPDVEIKVNPHHSFLSCVNVPGPGFYRIGDLYIGHTIFLEPGDSVFFSLIPVPNFTKRQQQGENLTKAYTLKVKAKYPGNFTYFDELEKKIGPTIKYHFEKPLIFKEKCDRAYATAMQLLNECDHQKIITDNFKRYAIKDIKARYVLWFCEMVSQINRSKIPPECFEFVSTLSFNDSTMAVSSNKYATAAAVYNYYIANKFDPSNENGNLSNEFNSIVTTYTGLIKDRLMGWQIEDYLGANNSAFDSCYHIFLTECKNERIKEEVIKKVNSYTPPVKNISRLSLNELLKTTNIEDAENRQLKLIDIIPDTAITVIDCWATWCIPCREQMPFIHDIEKKYKNKVNFIYLSFDKDEMKWKNLLNKNNLNSQQYIISNDFTSEFSQYFRLETIPRYILFSKSGMKVLNTRMPLPAIKDDFEAILNKNLDK